MLIRSLVLAALMVPVALPAASLRDTHDEISMPAGKTVKLFRPKDRACGVSHNHHQSGKTALPMRAPAARDCGNNSDYAQAESKARAE